jgi:hypothetical protein
MKYLRFLQYMLSFFLMEKQNMASIVRKNVLRLINVVVRYSEDLGLPGVRIRQGEL